jgi:Collagen triple helix repeat (20 copies)
MFSRIRKRLTYANVAMTLALVFAMSGGAYAAGKYLITSTKQISPKVLTALKGKNGKNGTNGTNGAQGPVGEKGPAGTNGTNGVNGGPGTPGSPGAKGATGATGPIGTTGPTGATGPQGPLQKGATETGAWSVPISMSSASGQFRASNPISFTLPLAAVPTATFIAVGGPVVAPCSGSVEEPGAEPSVAGGKPNLCVFEGEVFAAHKGHLGFATFLNFTKGSIEASRVGVMLLFGTILKTPPEEVSAEGTWAVTG